LLKESKDGRRQPRGTVDAHFASGRNHTGKVVRQPATGDVAHRMDLDRLEHREAIACIDPCRGEQFVAEGLA